MIDVLKETKYENVGRIIVNENGETWKLCKDGSLILGCLWVKVEAGLPLTEKLAQAHRFEWYTPELTLQEVLVEENIGKTYTIGGDGILYRVSEVTSYRPDCTKILALKSGDVDILVNSYIINAKFTEVIK